MKSQRLVIAANFTAEPVKESLAFWMEGLGLSFEFSFAPFDQIFQQLLDPSSETSLNTTGINLLLVKLDNWAGLSEGVTAPGADPWHRNVADLIGALRGAAERNSTPHILCVCPGSPETLADPRAAALLSHGEEMLRDAFAGSPSVLVITPDQIAAAYPVASWYDGVGESLGGIPYTEPYFAALGTFLARRVYALRSAPRKVLVVDCDNTLWRGVVGEVGVEGVQIDASMRAWQEFLVQQHESGMLLCLASKNNELDVAEVFQHRPEMPLRWDHFIGTRIDWLPKSGNLRSLAAELQLGLDSFVFVDDSSYEVEEVRSGCPEVLALQLPEEPAALERFARHGWAFDRVVVTDEDRRRAGYYRENLRRDSVRKRSTNLDDFLCRLELEVQITAPQPVELGRAAQLTQRTNQFNVSGVRRTEAELAWACQKDSLECRVVHVRDRFGDYGLVGLMLFRTGPGSLRVDSFLLSCRALGRRVEHRMLVALGEIARQGGTPRIEIPFVLSSRNAPALEFLNSLGVAPERITANWVFEVPPETALSAASLAAVIPAESVEDPGEPSPDAGQDGNAVTLGRLLTRIPRELYAPEQVLLAVASERKRSSPQRDRTILPPRNETERRIVEIWKQALRLDDVGVTENFFDLGGTSLAAVPMFAGLQEIFGPQLTPTLLFQAPTIEQLAAVLAATEPKTKGSPPRTSLVPVQPLGTRLPLFCIHAGAGTVLFYYPLARALGRDQPVFALQQRGIDGGEPHASIEGMAEQYIAEIKTVQPNGPYQLAGFCLGATIAFEMAQQLDKAGEKVSFLASFDGGAPGYPRGARPPPGDGARPSRFRDFADALRLNAMKVRNRILRAITTRTGGPVPVALRRFSWYFQVNNMLALGRYRPFQYPGTMHVFTVKGRFRQPHLGWPRLVTDGVVAHEVEGELRQHRDLMDEPMVSRVAGMVLPLLARLPARVPPAAVSSRGPKAAPPSLS